MGWRSSLDGACRARGQPCASWYSPRRQDCSQSYAAGLTPADDESSQVAHVPGDGGERMSASTYWARSRRVLRTAGMGHEEPFPPPMLRGRCGFGYRAFAAASGNGKVASIPAVLSIALEPLCLTESCPLRATSSRPNNVRVYAQVMLPTGSQNADVTSPKNPLTAGAGGPNLRS